MAARWMCAFALCALLAAVTSAEDNCGSMMRTTSRFRGTVRSIELIGEREVTVAPIDTRMSFVVSIDVDDVESGKAVPRVGERLNFGIHSPSMTFGAGKVVGRTFELETEWMECDGAFRRFLTLQTNPASRGVETFDGRLEVGHTYRARAKWSDGALTLVKVLHLPMHHEGGVMWTNADAYPDLAREGAVRSIVFEVVSVHITQTTEWEWLSLYDARIIKAR